MRVGIIGDIHLGLVWDGIDRFEEQKGILDALVPFAQAQKWENIVVLGDVFDTPRPYPIHYAYFIQWLQSLQDLGIHVRIIRGNHDGPAVLQRGNALRVVEEMKSAGTRTVASDHPLLVQELGYLVPHGLHLGEHDNVAQGYGFCHHDLTGATVGTEARMLRGGKSELVDRSYIKHWYAGHIHKPQDLERVTIVGSIIQVDKSEREEMKRVITLDTETGKAESHSLMELGACTFKSWTLDFVKDPKQAQALYGELLDMKALGVDGLVDVQVRMPPGAAVDLKALEDHLRSLTQVKHIRKIVPEIVVPAERRNTAVVAEQTPEAAIKEFVKGAAPEGDQGVLVELALDCVGRSTSA